MTIARPAVLALGSNLGDRVGHLQHAVDGLDATAGVWVQAISDVYETDPVGPDQPDYLNASVRIETTLTPRALLATGQRLEREARRIRGERWGPRTLDVDILFLGDEQVDEPGLVIPHPRLHERLFVLVPLRDVAPERVPSGAVPNDPADWPGVRVTSCSLVFPSDVRS